MNNNPTQIPVSQPDAEPAPVNQMPVAPQPQKSSKKKMVLLVILGLILLAAAAYAGYKWEHNRAVKVENQQSAQILLLQGQVNNLNKKVNDLNNQATSSSSSANSSVNYFAIKQWGVRAPYSGSLTLQYVIGTPPYSSSNAYFTSAQLVKADTGSNSTCGINRTSSSQNYGGGYIGRYLPTDTIPTQGPPTETAQAYLSQNFKASNTTPPAYSKVGKYYYIYWPPQGSCMSSPLVQQTEDAVKSVAKSLQATP